MVAPAVILFLLYIIIPCLYGVYYGFTNFTVETLFEFLGFRNYITLFKDKIFYIAFKNTGLVLAMSLLLIVPCSFGVVFAVCQKNAGREVSKSLLLFSQYYQPDLNWSDLGVHSGSQNRTH